MVSKYSIGNSFFSHLADFNMKKIHCSNDMEFCRLIHNPLTKKMGLNLNVNTWKVKCSSNHLERIVNVKCPY